MKTKILKIKIPTDRKILIAAKIIQRGDLVAFPTETVYGLGANALSAKSVRKIFVAKKRPFDDPLIVHVSNEEQVYELAKGVNLRSKLLMDNFWPGPLTLVLEKSKKVPSITTGGLRTVAIRMPAHKIAHALIEKAKVPIAAPSANLFGKPSPTNARDVFEDLNGRIDCIIDGGTTTIGVESTILDVSSQRAVLLRPGKISTEQIEKIIGKIDQHTLIKKKGFNKGQRGGQVAKAPGMKYKHYAPQGFVILIEESTNFWTQVRSILPHYKNKKVGIITSTKGKKHHGAVVKFLGKTPQMAARNIFKIFREFDRKGVEVAIVQGISEKGLGAAVMNRVRKAADKIEG